MFPPRPDFSLHQHVAKSVPQGDMLPVRVWFSRLVQDRARRGSYATLVEETKRNGGAEFTFTTFSLEWLAEWLLSFGRDAEALEPPKLRELVRQAAEAVARRHG